jgi:uncharacterized membrane protein YkvA (DUF1232 family)
LALIIVFCTFATHISEMSTETETETGRDVEPYDAKKLQRDEAKVRRSFWSKLRRVIGRIPFANDLLATYFAALDPNTPTYVRAALMAALAYFVVPIDVVPDFILAFGFSDDAAVLAATISAMRPHIKTKHYDQAANWIKGEAEK